MTVTEKTACRVCRFPLPKTNLLSLGEQAIVDFPKEGEATRGKGPLELVVCDSCKLLQLRHTVDQDTLYRKFWYRSGINEQMRDALADVVVNAVRKVNLRVGDAVCDIGSNDGELLSFYPAQTFKVGFEPADELAAYAQERFKDDKRWHIVPDYFGSIQAQMASPKKLYKIITACAMFYDLDDPLVFLQDVKSVLAQDGVFVVQMNYLGTMLRNVTFDNISHEHLCYYSLTTLNELARVAAMKICDVELNDVNGGSIRVYMKHEDDVRCRTTDKVKALLEEEKTTVNLEAIARFAERIVTLKAQILNFVSALKDKGKTVYAYGASTRGATLLQTVFQDVKAADYIIAAAERDERKYDREMAGLGIKIISEQEAKEDADYFLLLPYHFWPSIMVRERTWMLMGGKFIIPLPYPKVVGLEDTNGKSNFFPVAQDLDKALSVVR